MVADLTGAPAVLGVGDTVPIPTVGLEGITDLTGYSAEMTLVSDALTSPLVLTGAIVGSQFEFAFTAGDTDTAALWDSTVEITEPGGGIYTRPGFPVFVVDYDALWATVSDVRALVGEGYTDDQITIAILDAMEAVRTWVVISVPTSPVPERVERATTLLAARVLTTSGVSSEAEIISETIGDYAVRYAEAPTVDLISGVVADLLAPWGLSKIASVYIGPDATDAGPTMFYE